MIELLAEMKQKKVISIAHSKYISANHFKAALTKIKEIKEKNGN